MPRNHLLQVRRDTEANWTSTDPTLAAGEPGYVTDTNELVVGDGSTAFSSLPRIVVDSGTYQAIPTDTIRLRPDRFAAVFGSPTLGKVNNFYGWLFDQTSPEYIATELDVGNAYPDGLPGDWSTFDIKIVGANAGAGSGDVQYRVQHANWALGDTLPAVTSVAAVTFTAGAQYATQTTTLASGISVPADDRVFSFRVFRNAGDAADTLANDYAIKRVLLVKAS